MKKILILLICILVTGCYDYSVTDIDIQEAYRVCNDHGSVNKLVGKPFNVDIYCVDGTIYNYERKKEKL